MNRVVSILLAFGATVVLHAGAAHAQATRTWVSGVGDDVNPCSRTAPCKTFAGAISKTAANGEINCLDHGGFGGVTITKSMTIKCEGTVGSVLAAGFSGIVINDGSTGTPGTIVVTLSGLDIEGAGTGINGINFLSGAVLHVTKTQIRNFRNGGSGINFAPSRTAELNVSYVQVTDSGGAQATASGILVRPTSNAQARFTISNSEINNNANGIQIDSSATTGGINGLVRDTVVGGNTGYGIVATTSSAVTTNVIERVATTGNGTGLATVGLNAYLLVRDTTVTQNTTGLSPGIGSLLSYGNNSVNHNNGADGNFSGSVLLR